MGEWLCRRFRVSRVEAVECAKGFAPLSSKTLKDTLKGGTAVVTLETDKQAVWGRSQVLFRSASYRGWDKP